MKEFFKLTIWKGIAAFAFLAFDLMLSSQWIQVGFFNYRTVVIDNPLLTIGNNVPTIVPTNFSIIRFLVILAVSYLLACGFDWLSSLGRGGKIAAWIVPAFVAFYLISIMVGFTF